MGNRGGRFRQDVGEASDPVSIVLQAAATESESAPSSSSPYFSPRIQGLLERRIEFENREVEFSIEAARSHFTELSIEDHSDVVKSNQEIFETLKNDPELGLFFNRNSYKLTIGGLVGKGGQAEVYEATGTYKAGVEEEPLVVKAFDRGFRLESLKQMWPPGLMTESVSRRYFDLGSEGRYGVDRCCWAVGAQLLEDGRFAFLFPRHNGDLRSELDGEMLRRKATGPPFSVYEALKRMNYIAIGMAQLHKRGFLHQDLKAANVLCGKRHTVDPFRNTGAYYVADFESSVGTVGTSFWRAPEILLALRNRCSNPNLELPFTRATDVYSYAMTCYEVLTGRIPFEEVPSYDYDVVLRGERPTLPDDIPQKLKDLIERCWHADPLQRPSFQTIQQETGEMNFREKE